MNPRQKRVLLVGIVLVGLAALYSPWNFVDQYYPYSRDVERFAGYSFLFAPPVPIPPMGEHPIATVSRLDTRRLIVEFVVVLIVVVGLMYFSSSRPVLGRISERLGRDAPDSGSSEGAKRWALRSRFPAQVFMSPWSDVIAPTAEGSVLAFVLHAETEDFSAAAAAILQRLRLRLRNKERVHLWLTQNRRRFSGIVFGGEPTDSNFEAAIALGTKRLMPRVFRYLHSLRWSRNVTFAGLAPHWSIADLSNEGVDLEALAQHAVDVLEDELTSELRVENAPLLFLDSPAPKLPYWLPKKYGRRLTPVETVEWFDELLRFYWQKQKDLVEDHSPSDDWPPAGDKDRRLRGLVTVLYLMYFDAIDKHLPKPSSIADK